MGQARTIFYSMRVCWHEPSGQQSGLEAKTEAARRQVITIETGKKQTALSTATCMLFFKFECRVHA